MRAGGFLAIGCAVALLSGCAATPLFVDESPLLTSDVAADSPPAFADVPADPAHPLPDATAETLGLDEETAQTVRYQGDWFGEQLYLYDGHGTVFLLGVSIDDPEMWHTGSSLGNVPFAMESGDTTDDEWMLQYLPQGTADLPDGWTAFSPYLASRDL